ncbi:AMP-binding protein [Pseudolysinimonas sp.]|jgi:acyl-CoA synthetase (AMP-forming)/AMP-acid ligase II|uniref:AMP-binding protein n=1 Tax=Pseudolysinimonas sp. TaxID=2680009 RepID=UPI003785263A
MSRLSAPPGTTVLALASLLRTSGALRHPLKARDAARRGLPGAIALAAARDPHRPALLRDGETITTAALDAEVRALAAGLTLPRRSRIGVRSDGGIGFVVTLAAVLASGADAVPLGPRLADADVAALALDDVLEPRREAGVAPRRAVAPGRLLLLTTGTTGSPLATARGPLGVRALAQLADADRRLALPTGPLLLLAPPDHGHGLSAVAGALVRGIPVVLASARTTAEQADLAALHRPATVSGVPAQLARLLDAGGLHGVRVVVSGSSPLTAALRARLTATGATVHDAFGATGVGTVAIDGLPLAGVRLRRTADGCLEVRSPLGRDAWVASGDRVEIAGGRLHPLGRWGDLVDSGGELVDPRRLQRLLATHPGVADARVVVVDDDLLGAVLHARVDADPAIETGLRAAINASLGRAEHPRRLEFGPVDQAPSCVAT